MKSQAVGLPETKNQKGRTFDETFWVHICISKKSKKLGKVIMKKVATSRKKVRLVIDKEKQDPFQFVSVWLWSSKCFCSTQEEVLVSTEIEFDISLVLKKSCLRKLATSPRKLLYYLAVIRSRIDADKARPVDKQLVTDLRKTSF